jgi:hypothetical protein
MILYNLTPFNPSQAFSNTANSCSAPLPSTRYRQTEAPNPIHSAPLTLARPNPALFLRKQSALPAEHRDQEQLESFARDPKLELNKRMQFAELLASGPKKESFFDDLLQDQVFLETWKQYAYPKVAVFVNSILPAKASRDGGEARVLLLAAIAQDVSLPSASRIESVRLVPHGPKKTALVELLARDKRLFSLDRFECAQLMPAKPQKQDVLESFARDETFLMATRIASAKAMQDGPRKDSVLEFLIQSVISFDSLKAQRLRLKQGTKDSGVSLPTDDVAIYFDVYYHSFECIQGLSTQSQRQSCLEALLSEENCPQSIKERLKDCTDPKNFLLRLLLNFAVA